MDESKENLQSEIKQRITQTREKMNMASKARRLINHAITHTKTFTPEEAVRLGCLRILYETEWQIYFGDYQIALGELEGKDWRVPDQEREWRLKGEDILSTAIRGEYSLLKKELRRRGEGLLDDVKRGHGQDLNIERDIKGSAMKLLELEAAIPEKSEPFHPPPPAWEDPGIINTPDPGGNVWW